MQLGCLLVEMHDSRPVKGAATKIMEPSVTKLILRPTVESLWADIRSLVDSQRGWGDKEALELEARIVVRIRQQWRQGGSNRFI
jgi:transcription factor SPT20